MNQRTAFVSFLFAGGPLLIAAFFLGLALAAHEYPVAYFLVGFCAVVSGLSLFLFAKLSAMAQHRRWVTFGPGLMTANQRQRYFAGYVLMLTGGLALFGTTNI